MSIQSICSVFQGYCEAYCFRVTVSIQSVCCVFQGYYEAYCFRVTVSIQSVCCVFQGYCSVFGAALVSIQSVCCVFQGYCEAYCFRVTVSIQSVCCVFQGYCSVFGAALVSIQSDRENSFLAGLIGRDGAGDYVDIIIIIIICLVSRFGLAVRRQAGKRKDLGSIPLRFSFLFKKVVVCGHCLLTLSITSY